MHKYLESGLDSDSVDSGVGHIPGQQQHQHFYQHTTRPPTLRL